MTDKFKKYLSENYDQLSPEEPDEKVWRQISRLSRKNPGRIFFLNLKRMAAACVIILIGVNVWNLAGNHKKHTIEGRSVVLSQSVKNPQQITPLIVKEDTKEQVKPPEIKKSLVNITSIRSPKKKNIYKKPPQQSIYISSEQLTLQYVSSFTKLIENEKTAISTTPVYGVTSEYFDVFIKEYRLLEANENSIREKIKFTAGSIEALDEMILNFQKRIDLLKRLRAEIGNVNKLNQGRRDVQTNYVRVI